MDLWIRSQDRETLIKANRIDVVDTEIIIYEDDLDIHMAVYETKERALEVLDEIQDVLESVHTTDEYKKEVVVGGNMFYELPKE